MLYNAHNTHWEIVNNSPPSFFLSPGYFCNFQKNTVIGSGFGSNESNDVKAIAHEDLRMFSEDKCARL